MAAPAPPDPKPAAGRRLPAAALFALAALVLFNVVLSTSVQDALFLMHHPKRRIPLAMLLGSLGTAAATALVNRLLRDRSPVASLRAILVALGVAMGAAAAWNTRPGPASTFALFLLVEIATTLGAAATWGYFQAPLDPAGIRTLLPRLSLAGGVGGFAASLVIRALPRAAGPRLLPWIAALAWIAGALLVRAEHAPPPGRRRRAAAREGGLAELAAMPLVRWMVVGSAGVIWVGLVVSYELRVALQHAFADPADIARTMGLLLGGAAVLGIAIQALATPRILSRFGVGVALAVLPASIAVCLAGWLAAPLLAFAVAAALCDKTLRQNLHRSAESCLVGALPPPSRPPLAMALGGIVAPSLKAIGALALLGAAAVDPRWLAAAALGLALLLVLLGWRWGRIYADGLRATLAAGSVETPSGALGAEAVLPLIDGPRLQILLRAIEEGGRRQRELALELLRPHREPMVARAMAARVRSPVEAVRIAALRWHAAEPAAALQQHIRARWAEPEVSAAERVALLEAAGPAAADLVGSEASRWLNAATAAPAAGAHRSLRQLAAAIEARAAGELGAAVASALARSGDPARRGEGHRALAALLASPSSSARVLALQTIARLGGDGAARALLPDMLRAASDPDLAVRREALAALPALGGDAPGSPAREALWGALADPRLAAAAARALAACGESILPEVLAALAPVRERAAAAAAGGDPAAPAAAARAGRIHLLRILGLVPSRAAVPALQAELESPDRAARLEALRSLDKLHRDDPGLPVDAARLEVYLLHEVARGLQLVQCKGALAGAVSRHGLLARELAFEIEGARERVSRALALRAPPDTMRHVFRSLRAPASPEPEADQARAQARELLRTILLAGLPAGPLRAAVTRLLDERGPWPPECFVPPIEVIPFTAAAPAFAFLERIAEPGLRAALDVERASRDAAAHPEVPVPASIETVLFLKDVLLFESLASVELSAVARLAARVDLPAGHTLFRRGDPPDDLYIVCEGKLRVVIDGDEVARLGPGECIGEMAVLGGTARTATVETVTPCRLLRFDGDDFLALLDVHPEIGRALLRSLVRRLANAARPSEGLLSTIEGLIKTGASLA